MQLANHQLLISLPALEEIASAKIPAPAAMRVAKALRLLRGAAADFNAGRQKVIDELAKRDSAGKIVEENGTIPWADPAAANAAMSALLIETVDVDLAPISPDVLGTAEVRPADLANLHWLFV